MAYEINYNDQRFQDVEAGKKAALNEVDVTYGQMIGDSDKYYQAQIDASKQWAETQKQQQQEQTDFAIEKIEQEKEQAKKDYTKEQSGAYVDWQKQSDQYGANAEQMAAQGLQDTGYSESSQVSMFNTYQNRVVAAREAYTLAVQNYNNAITEARLQNNAALAEIAYQALQQQLELSLQGFQYKNQLIIEKANQKRAVENEYYGRYQDVLAQMNTENALAEQVRQYNASLAEEKRQHDANLAEEKRQYDLNRSLEVQKFEYQKKQSSSSGISKSSGSSGSSGSSKSGSSSSGSIKKTSSSSSIAKSSGGSGGSGKIPASTKNSILALGQGPISAKNLAKQVASGKVIEKKDKNGKSTFSYNLLPSGLLTRYKG